ncbi:MAG: hypothetical protein ACRENB_16710 [Gemmatimonadales bacterium]
MPSGDGWRRVQLVSRQTVELLDALREPRGISSVTEDALPRLVLDGLIEIESGGVTHSGPAAHSLFFHADTAAGPDGPLARLSIEALQYSAATGLTEPRALADRLYRHNSRPLSPAWRARLPDAASVSRLLEAGRRGAAARRRRSHDAVLESAGGRGVWRVWDRDGALQPSRSQVTFKLYVSVGLPAVGQALHATLALFDTKSAPFSIKVGRDLATLLRPDKLVAYFVRHEDLVESAARLARELGGMPAQGVPFTAVVDGSLLLSWAADPAIASEPPGPLRRGSWRGWVVTRLGAALATGNAAAGVVPPWRFALDRVSLDGVDPRTWTRADWLESEPPADADH